MKAQDLSPPGVNGVLETSLYVEDVLRAAEFYQRIFGFAVIDDGGEVLSAGSRLCALRAGDRSVLLLFKKGGTADTDASGAIHVAFAVERIAIPEWERWLAEQGIVVESRETWKYGGQSLYFRDLDGHLLELVTPGVWTIY
jgi:catechol 2,3-dioxygenase-like lactoylglutathione lyase family enzyme